MKRAIESVADRCKKSENTGHSPRGPVQMCMTGWYNELKARQLEIPPKKIRPLAHQLSTVSESYRAMKRLIPYNDSIGTVFPINNLQELVPAANRHMKMCEKGRAFKTFPTDDTGKTGVIPDGMHIFTAPEAVTRALYQDMLYDINVLYKDPRYRKDKRIHMLQPNTPPNNEIIFYNRSEGPQPTFLEIIGLLYEITPRLAEYTMIYYNIIKGILKADYDEMERVSLTYVHYDRKAGINPHIDAVHVFGNTLGPIFTVAIGESEKMFDLIPVLLPGDHKPVRLFSHVNEIMVMDGASRILWAHAKPWGCNPEQFTLVFKFPALKNRINVEHFVFEDTSIEIPYYVT